MWVTVSGWLSDVVGRKNMFMFGCVLMGAFGFIYFAMLDTMNPTIIFIAISISLLPVMTLYGPEAALIAESFSPRLRYSGASLGYQLASIIAGGPSPFIATALFAYFGASWPIAVYMLLCAVIGLVIDRDADATTLAKKSLRNTKAFELNRAGGGLAPAPAARSQFRKILPGFMIPRGSMACLTEYITASASWPCSRSRNSRLPMPTPCSPLHDPPRSSARETIFLSCPQARARPSGVPAAPG